MASRLVQEELEDEESERRTLKWVRTSLIFYLAIVFILTVYACQISRLQWNLGQLVERVKILEQPPNREVPR